jgi:hypothetical protein
MTQRNETVVQVSACSALLYFQARYVHRVSHQKHSTVRLAFFKPMRIAYNSLSALLHSLFLPHSGLTDGIHLMNHVAEPKQIKAVQRSMVEPYGDLVQVLFLEQSYQLA